MKDDFETSYTILNMIKSKFHIHQIISKEENKMKIMHYVLQLLQGLGQIPGLSYNRMNPSDY